MAAHLANKLVAYTVQVDLQALKTLRVLNEFDGTNHFKPNQNKPQSAQNLSKKNKRQCN